MAKITLKIKAPTTPQNIICFRFFGTKLAAIKPIIIALSAARIMSIKIIWDKIKASSIKVVKLY